MDEGGLASMVGCFSHNPGLRGTLQYACLGVLMGLTFAAVAGHAADPPEASDLGKPVDGEAADYEICHLRGAKLFRENKLEEARRSLVRAIALDGSHPDDHTLLGDVYGAQEKFALAVEAYERAGRLGLDDAAWHFKLAAAYFRLRNYLGEVKPHPLPGGAAGTFCEQGYVVEPIPRERDAFYVSPPQSAVFHAQKARTLGLDTPELRLLLGDTWLEARRYDRALGEYQEVETQVPQARRAAYYGNYARALWGAGDPEGYLARLQKAAEHDRGTYGPALDQAYVRVAELYNQEGDLEKHVECLRRAVERAPASSDLHYRLGNALWESGRRDEAVRQWRIALELQPNHPDRARLLDLIQTARTPNGD
ncbi:MAG: tetratricopeptide repeat protein [Planctomycetota bacterium]